MGNATIVISLLITKGEKIKIIGYNIKRFLEKYSKELELMINKNSNFNLLEQ
jgi:hypothetical protein